MLSNLYILLKNQAAVYLKLKKNCLDHILFYGHHSFDRLVFLAQSWVPRILVKKQLAERHLSDGHLTNGQLSNRLLTHRHLSDRHLTNGHLSNRHLLTDIWLKDICQTFGKQTFD